VDGSDVPLEFDGQTARSIAGVLLIAREYLFVDGFLSECCAPTQCAAHRFEPVPRRLKAASTNSLGHPLAHLASSGMDATQLAVQLHAEEISPQELGAIVSAYFGRVQYEGSNTLAYLRDERVALSITVEDGRVTSIQPGPALTDADVVALGAQIRNGALVHVGHKIRRQVAFAVVPVTGSWRYRDLFQIMPAPNDAPRPPGVIGPHPFILEASYPDSPDPLIANNRASGAITDASRLLAAFVPWIDPPTSWGHIEHQWAIP